MICLRRFLIVLSLALLAMQDAFAHDGPAVIEVMTTRQELSFPPKIEAAQASGFALWATRSILSGRGDDRLCG